MRIGLFLEDFANAHRFHVIAMSSVYPRSHCRGSFRADAVNVSRIRHINLRK
jgi:hypothetical protein